MDSEDGRLFLKHLAYYIRTHEKALANTLLPTPQSRRHTVTTATLDASPESPKTPSRGTPTEARPSTSGGLLSLGRSQKTAKPPRLFLTPNQLYYLLVRFEELGVNVGPLNIRTEDLHAETPSANYMSFLAHAPSKGVRDTDADSIHSVVSVRSTMSSMSSLWSRFSFSGSSSSRAEKQDAATREDIRYLYSAFTKIPCVKLSVDARFRPITGYEEFPFDTAIPMHAFKNLTEFEVSDIDFRSVYGWDRLADQLRSLVVKRASLNDVSDLLTKIVVDDMDQRRRKSSKTPSTPISAFPSHNPFRRSGDWSQSLNISDHSTPERRPSSGGDARKSRPRLRSISPQQLLNENVHSTPVYTQSKSAPVLRRFSNSTNSSPPAGTPRQSSSNLSLLASQLPSFKWRFLRFLSIADNGLTTLTAEALSPVCNTLQSLDLSSNLFTEIPDCLSSLTSLRALNMSNCMIDSVRSLAQQPLSTVAVLNLRSNRLSSLIGIESLKSLKRLDVCENRMTDPVELSRLTCIPEMRDVYVKGNPFVTKHESYRVTIFNLFRAVPGYTEDVTIDELGPNYGERRHLIGRALPVMPIPDPRPSRSDGRPSLHEDESKQSTVRAVPSDDNDEAAAAAKRKGAKRRVVDLTAVQALRSSERSQELRDGDGSASIATKQAASTEASARPSVESSVRTPPNYSKSTATASSPCSPTLSGVSGPPVASSVLADTLSQTSEVYKKKIEALKSERGSAWLTAIESIGPQQQNLPHEAVSQTGVASHPFQAPQTPTLAAAPSV